MLIPACNAQATIGPLIFQLKEKNLDVVVVDDGSQDDTAEIGRSLGAKIIEHPKNLGKGKALRTGFEYTLRSGYDGVITLDADGQHNPSFIPLFLEEIRGADLIIGSRMKDRRGMPWPRVLSNRLTSVVISALTHTRVEDSQCGYRLVKREVLERVKLSTSRFQTESELLIKGAKAGFRIGWVPISTLYQGEGSLISPILDTLRFMALALRALFW